MISRLKRFEAYAATVREAQASSFEYGYNDSMTFVARCVERMLGIDRLAEIKPADERAAKRQLFRGVIPLLGKALGVPEVQIDDIQIGDPCAVRIGTDVVAGLWSGTRVAVFRPSGFETAPAEAIVASWRIT